MLIFKPHADARLQMPVANGGAARAADNPTPNPSLNSYPSLDPDARLQMPDADGGAPLAADDSLETVAKLTRTNRYKNVMGRVRDALEAGVEAEEEQAWTGHSEESPTYRLMACPYSSLSLALFLSLFLEPRLESLNIDLIG